MFILLTGENNSGKSRCAERIAAQIPSRRVYAATMIPFGAEGLARREKHLRQRAGLGFRTVECPCDLSLVTCGPNDLVLLEDVSNLLANLIFAQRDPSAEKSAERQIVNLRSRCAVLIAVTITRLDERDCDGETLKYVAALNRLNGRLAAQADAVVEMRGGVPFSKKGQCPWIG
ncbi:MAG: bifunctional adenosylcobinamide kinase/adenosylcobinamide-phosphate guanylyltransferase [Pyramidobacter sp.]|jgi:adenosylcobinamide kinase/adenosylcobinamide-phosphate guanylyltransferase